MILEILILNAALWVVILVVLLIALVFKKGRNPDEMGEERVQVKDDLKKIKEQINSEED